MISLFKKKEAYEVATSKEPKPAQPAYPKKLTKVQYKDRLNTNHAAAWAAAQAASSAGSTTVTPQSKESTTTADTAGAAGAPASQSSSASLVLTWDDIKNLYQSHKKE